MDHFEALYPAETREREISKIVEFIRSGRSVQLIGLPGVGRSNVLGLLSYNRNVRFKHFSERQKWFHFVYLDFSEVKKRGLFDVIKFILISIAYSLSERNLKEEYEIVNTYIKEAVSFNDELILFQALKKAVDFLAIEKELTLVLLFDRFEQYAKEATEQFFLNLKVLRNRAKYRFSAVFSLSRALEDLIDPYIFAEFYEFVSGNTVFMNLYDKAGVDFRLAYLEKAVGKKISSQYKEKILELTGGHGKLVKLCSEAILGESKESPGLKQFLLAKNTVRSALQEIWASLTPFEQNYLENGAKDEAPAYLQDVGLVDKQRITIPLLQDFIAGLPKERISEEITYNLDKNEILKGNLTISDNLSASEFRLLRFLIENRGKVCEKDEIIKVVWRDSKTQAGVTDQALDQIIYRLRKKIEDNPNAPLYIQTVKGRGFKFAEQI